MPARLTTVTHLAISVRMYLSNCATVSGCGVTPSSARRLFTAGMASALLISALSLATIGAGVFAGATMPHHTVVSSVG